jgi:acid stress chaperone HdeB
MTNMISYQGLVRTFPKALVLTVAATTFCLMTSPAFAVEETTPQNMTCQEFMDMNPKSMTPVAFWVVNRNTDFSGGDYVDWHEVETVSVPKMLQVPRTPPLNLAISARSSKITPASGRGNPPRCGGSRFTHRYRIRTAESGR